MRVSATNAKGTGTASSGVISTGARVLTVSSAAPILARGSTTSETKVQLTWTSLVAPATGNSPVTSYTLYWDSGLATVDPPIFLSTATSLEQTILGLVTARDYRFKIRANNRYGSGPWSTVLQVKTSDNPHTMDPIDTYRSGTDMIVEWVAPQSGGETIDAYEVSLYIPSTDTFVIDTNCDASVDPILSAL